MSSREFELYAEGFFLNREWQMEALAWMQANLISPHIKGKITANQIYKAKSRDAEKSQEDDRIESINSEIEMAERRLRMTKSTASKEELQKLNDKIDRLYASIQTVAEERDIEQEYLESAEHLRSVSFLPSD